MRYVNGVLCALLVLFAVAQYNDPDVVLWVVIYAVPAIWTGLAAFRPHVLAQRSVSMALALCVIAAVIGTAYWWPTDPGWWRQEVWWESEPAREGMGLMIITIALLAVALTWWLGQRKPGGTA